ncbi:MAG: hydroxymethylbilane synthase [Gallionellaceae bacterium]|nr:hydroxymethylbilane synthase [Gallionellaceae bacterium]
MNQVAQTTTVPKKLVIASRESALAMWQAEHIRDRLRALYPQTDVSILGMTTQGDQILDVSLSKIGGKGLFVKELETALENGSADIAVHSLKDVPMHLPEGFVLACIGKREDPRDAFVSNHHANLEALPAGSIVGTSSLRRESQLRARFPHLKIEPLRGNVQTRLRKLDEGQYAAIILAAAGLKRLGLGERIRAFISSEESLPAVGQGALGIEIRADRKDLEAVLRPLHDAETAACVFAERAMSRALAGSCQVPLGGFAEVQGDKLRMRGFVASPDGSKMLRAEQIGSVNEPEVLGNAIADELLKQGAGAILAALNG